MEKLYQALREILSGWQVCGYGVVKVDYEIPPKSECKVCGYVASNWHADLKDWNGFF